MERNHVLDLNLRAFTQRSGDLEVIGSWVGTEELEPALVIRPAYRNAKPCIIALSAAYKYDNPRYLAHATRAFLKIMGLDDNAATLARVAELIHSRLPDLLAIPPAPTRTVEIGEGEVQDASGRKATFTMLDHIPESEG